MSLEMYWISWIKTSFFFISNLCYEHFRFQKFTLLIWKGWITVIRLKYFNAREVTASWKKSKVLILYIFKYTVLFSWEPTFCVICYALFFCVPFFLPEVLWHRCTLLYVGDQHLVIFSKSKFLWICYEFGLKFHCFSDKFS